MDPVSALAASTFFAALDVVMAHRRGRGSLPWGFIGSVFPFALLLLLVLPGLDSPRIS